MGETVTSQISSEEASADTTYRGSGAGIETGGQRHAQ